MTVIPVVTPITFPDVKPTVATVAVQLVQWPPVVASVKVVASVSQTWNVPSIATGVASTVTRVVTLHPVASL